MSMSTHRSVSINLGGLCLIFFIVVKLIGHVFATWSWWWVLLPIVPCIGLLVEWLGL